MTHRLRSLLGPIVVCGVLCFSFWLLYREARDAGWDEFRAGLTGTNSQSLLIALLLIALNYILLMTYDLLALRYVGHPLPLRRVALTSFLGYSLGNNLGTLLAGAPIRLRVYTRFGLRPAEVVGVVAFTGLTFWAGASLLSGLSLSFVTLPLPDSLDMAIGSRAIGWIMISAWGGYALLCTFWRRPLPLLGGRIVPPSPDLMLLQSCVAALDLTISATALYLVLPVDAIVPFGIVLSAYLLGMVAGLATQVPGQLGVLEAVLVTLLSEEGSSGAVLGSLLIFRGLYYILPLLAGSLLLVIYETTTFMQGRAARREAIESSGT